MMTDHTLPAPDTLTPVERLLRAAVSAERQDQFYGFYGLLTRAERAALYEEALCRQVTQQRAAVEVVREFVMRLSEEEIP